MSEIPSENQEQDKWPEPTPAEIERASDALMPFVDRWKLPLNPEDVEVIAYAALRFRGEPGTLEDYESQEYMSTEDEVIELIDAHEAGAIALRALQDANPVPNND